MIQRIICGHDELVSKIAASEHSDPNNERMPIERKHYLNRPTIPLNDDVLEF